VRTAPMCCPSASGARIDINVQPLHARDGRGKRKSGGLVRVVAELVLLPHAG
jgi:hypothetical protein